MGLYRFLLPLTTYFPTKLHSTGPYAIIHEGGDSKWKGKFCNRAPIITSWGLGPSWSYALEKRGLKVNRRKTEYMCVHERQDTGSGTVKMQGEEVAKVDDFKYLGSTVQSNGERGREVKKREQAGWNGWRRMSGVICDRRVPARVKGNVYKVAVRPEMLYVLETVALTKRQEAEMEVAELKMLRFSLGVTRMDKIRNEYIRGTALLVAHKCLCVLV